MKRVLTMTVVFFAMVLVVASCRKDDVRTVVIRVPGMHNEACVQVIRRALAPAQYGVRMDSIKAGAVPSATIDDGLKTLAICAAVHESFEKKASVPVSYK